MNAWLYLIQKQSRLIRHAAATPYLQIWLKVFFSANQHVTQDAVYLLQPKWQVL